MSKLGNDGKPIYNNQGKVMKGPNYFKPDLSKFIKYKEYFNNQEIDKAIEGQVNYMAMGQICIAKTHRGQGIFRKLYQTMKEKLPKGFDTIITEVDGKNKRSLVAHTAIGFNTLTIYNSNGKEWHVLSCYK